MVTYGAFLEKTDTIIRHGLAPEALALVRSYFPEPTPDDVTEASGSQGPPERE